MADTDTRLAAVARRWPTVVGVVFAALMIGLSAGRATEVLTAAAFVYLGSAALGHRAAAWPLFGLTFVLIGVGFAVPGFSPFWTMLGLGAALVVHGVIRGALRPGWGLPLQTAAMVVVAAVALAAMVTGLPWAALIVAAGLLAHAGWDVHHLRTQRVVAHSMAEFCAALDTVLAVALAVTAWASS